MINPNSLLYPNDYESNEMDNFFAATNLDESQKGIELQEIGSEEDWVFVGDKNEKNFNPALYDPLIDFWKFRVFACLDYKELGRMSLVCNKWRIWISDEKVWGKFDLQKLFPQTTLMDVEFWKNNVKFIKEVGIDLSNIPPISKRKIIPVLARLSKMKVSVTLLTMPEGLSSNKLLTLNNKNGKHIRPVFYDPYNENKRIHETYTAVIPTSKFVKEISVNDLKEFIQEKGCELPHLSETLTMFFLKSLIVKNNNLSIYPHTVVCSDTATLFKNRVIVYENDEPRSISVNSLDSMLNWMPRSDLGFFGVIRIK